MNALTVGVVAALTFVFSVLVAWLWLRRCDEHERWQRWYGVR